ncbi:hypothetical protein QYE76_028731 [Lolium multiflorum]|uniref:Uncharacterized protein n=1 Tax=Lolium multiflorum TaxID=4521 RepID=A0AAD8VHG4_LOLMU|nr:hypothetical protein QYE76_028731 [Lolium multiflorum]
MRKPRYGKPSDAAAANPISGDSEISSGTLPEGIHLPEDSTPPWSPPDKLGKLEAVHGGEVFNRIGVHSGFRGFIEAVWMKRFIVELGVVPSALDPLVIYCDNMGAIANAQEPRSHKRLKHIKLRYHSIREYIEDGEVKICKVHTDLNVAIR